MRRTFPSALSFMWRIKSDWCKVLHECAAALGFAPAPARAAGTTQPPPPEKHIVTLRTPLDPHDKPDGERKTVTALFADIKGSMELIEDLDPEEARRLVDPALKLMMEAVHHYGGYVAQSTGDGIFALFGAPVAHEDHPQRALHAARRMQEDLKRYADRLRERGQPPLSVRVGVNSGEVVVRSIQTGDAQTEYTPIGHSISLAARLQTLAAPGSVVIGESVRKFVEGYFQLKALGASRIKGVSEPVNVYEVMGLGPLRTRLQRAAGRGLTKFVGRQSEIEALKRAAELAKQGHGQIVAAMAEAGVGKSRLFFEFKARNQSGWMVLEAFSVSHGKASAYFPVLDLLTLSVIGREFPLSLIRSALPKPEEELDRMLNDLQLGEFIYEQPALGDTEYMFKHALTQEVSYNSVLIERRKHLHERIAAAVEQLYANSIDDHLDELAHHYNRSGDVPKAVGYYERAGLRAVQRSAYAEAMRDLTTALELLQRTPQNAERDQRELALQTSLGPVLMATKGWAAPETERVYLRAQELAETGGTPAQRFSLLTGLFGISFIAGRLPAAGDRQKQIRDFTRQHPEPAFVLEACHHDWSFALSVGELETAQRHVDDGLAFYDAQLRSAPVPLYSAHHPAVCGHAWGAAVSWLRGYPDAAQRHANQALSLAHELGDSPSIVFALGMRAQVHQVMREVRPALEMAEAAIAMAEKDGFPFFVSYAGIVKGWALAQLSQAEEGVAQIREGLTLAAATGSGLWRTYNLAQLAEACGKAGRIDEGLDAIAEALYLMQQNGERWWEAEIHRLRGELLFKQRDSNPAEAQASIEQAIEVACRKGAKSLQLRATTSLARLLDRTGHRDEACTMLAEIYGWFTEGFDTADLKDAKALLDELNA